MINQNPFVSVIIPVYNGERYLAEAIKSVLAQTYQNFELIVINDGSTDNTSNIIARYQDSLHSIYQPNAGLPASLNLGISLSRGEWIAFLDADDLWLEEKLSRQIRMVVENPEIEIIFGHVQQFLSSDLDDSTQKKIYCSTVPTPGYLKITMMTQRKAFEKVGLFREDQSIGDFIEWYLRASEANLNIYMLSEVVAKRRLHAWHTTDNSPESRKNYVRILKASLDRRRATSKKKNSSNDIR